MKSGYVKLLFLGIVLFLIALNFITYKSLDNYIKEVRVIRHSSDVQETLERLLSSIKDSEIGHYGYQLTRDSVLLVPYHTSVVELPGVLKLLDSLVSRNAVQKSRVDTLKVLIDNQFGIVGEILSNAKRSELYMDRYETGLIARSRDNMDAIRSLGRRIRADEERIVEQRSTSETGNRNVAPVSLLFYGLASLAGIAFLFTRVLDELEKRKKAEDSLRDSIQTMRKEVGIREFTQKTLRNVIDNSLDCIMAFRALRDNRNEIVDFEWILANAVSLATLYSKEKTLLGKKLLEVTPGAKSDGLFEMFRDAVESAVPSQIERQFSGDVMNAWYNITAVKLEDGLVVTFSDITSQKMQRMLIEEREVLLKDAEEVANMGSWRWMRQNDELIWSDGLYRILGKSPLDYTPSWSSFTDNVNLEDRPAMRSFLADLRWTPKTSRLEYRIDVNNKTSYLAMVLKPAPTHTLQPDVLGTVIDITERKLYENQLKQYTSELKRSNEDLEQFAYVASHDLQEPLRKIRAFGDLATKSHAKGDALRVDYIQRMQSAAARMQVLIEDLLLFSRVSRSANQFERVAMPSLMDEVLDDINEQIRREHALVEVGPLPDIMGDHTQIRRLFQNLISNGIKFHKPDQQSIVNISGRIMRSSDIYSEYKLAVAPRDWACFIVRDNGIGFEEKYAEKIFNIFQRLHGRNEYEGTGIGLSICRKIVSNHQGHIFARSEENVGSEFIIILPVD
ncbi:ATP-binding protein [Chryseolinea sp. T2]|uniref:sensor histidine kinase n=1 Tax=Chryseolinea sp. T2 TaxID=3129255 RepID=UPI003076ED47